MKILLAFSILLLAACHDPDRYEPTSTGSMPESEPETAPETPSQPAGLSVRFSHWNASSWDGAGTSLVLCSDQRASSVTLNGDPLRLHGNLDEGRQVWTDYDTPGRTGTVVVTLPQGIMTFLVRVTSGIVRRGC